MSKRVNPQRRLRQRQAAILTGARLERSAEAGAEMAKLQQGRVRSSAEERIRVSRNGNVSGALTTVRPPRQAVWEGKGKAKRALPARFNGQPKGPVDVDAPHAKVDVPNVAALKAAKVASSLQDGKRERKWGIKLHN